MIIICKLVTSAPINFMNYASSIIVVYDFVIYMCIYTCTITIATVYCVCKIVFVKLLLICVFILFGYSDDNVRSI